MLKEYEKAALVEIKRRLVEFRDAQQLRDSWHEPDEGGVSAVVTGTRLDNTYGAIQTGSGYYQELVVHLEVDGELELSINLADLLALATM